MTSDNDALIRDAKALIRESLHIKRAAGWADIANQLCTALARSEEVRESLETKVSELTVQLDRALYDASAHIRKASVPEPLPIIDDDDLADALELSTDSDSEDEAPYAS